MIKKLLLILSLFIFTLNAQSQQEINNGIWIKGQGGDTYLSGSYLRLGDPIIFQESSSKYLDIWLYNYTKGEWKSRFTFSGNGFLGVGINNPLSPLHIKSSDNKSILIDFTGIGKNDSYTYQSFHANSVEQWKLVGRNNNNANLEYWNQQSKNVLTLRQNGNVGIGTNSPNYPLEVITEVDGLRAGHFWNKHATGRGLVVSAASDNSTYAFQIRKFDNTQKLLTVLGNGNVGIGTSSPNDMLNLHSANSHSNIGLKITRGNETHGLRVGVNNKHAFLWTTENQNLALATSNKERLTITSGGNIGIGTTSPDQALTVKGKIHAEEIIVDLNIPHPDYVFSKNYNLKSLEEVESHIKTKGHLEGIPKSAEVKKNGLSLGELNTKLLEKIEELTLYMIKQNKETKVLKEKMNALNSKLKLLEQKNRLLKKKLEEK